MPSADFAPLDRSLSRINPRERSTVNSRELRSPASSPASVRVQFSVLSVASITRLAAYCQLMPSRTTEQKTVLSARAVERTLKRMANEIVELNDGTADLIIVGIQRRGVQLAGAHRQPHRRERGRRDSSGVARHHALPRRSPDHRPAPGRRTDEPSWDIEGMNVVIVDDVLYTGRTVRAALDELADFGRPARIALAVLVDRGGRELPIHAGYRRQARARSSLAIELT